MMTPQLFVKLTQQIARQVPEAEALEAAAAYMQPNIDSAQAWVDSCQASADSAQTMLAEMQATEDADTTAQQDAVAAANSTLEAAKSDLAKAKASQDEAIAHAKQIRAAITDCESLLSASSASFSASELEAAARVVPDSVEMVQARLALLEAGITNANVLAIIEQFPEPARSAAAIEWEFRPRVRRHSALVIGIGKALNLSDAQIDDLFIAADKK